LAPLLLLTGYMGSGKSTVGRAVARLLEWGFIDLDDVVVAQSGLDIPSIFRDEGEAGFRRRERAALRELTERELSSEGLVVALGGGTLTDPENAALAKDRATVVYLEVDAAEAWRRVCHSDRPLARDREEFESRLARRRSHYEEAADLVIPADRESVETLAKRIAGLVRQKGRNER
jgi:shikimate kinase